MKHWCHWSKLKLNCFNNKNKKLFEVKKNNKNKIVWSKTNQVSVEWTFASVQIDDHGRWDIRATIFGPGNDSTKHFLRFNNNRKQLNQTFITIQSNLRNDSTKHFLQFINNKKQFNQTLRNDSRKLLKQFNQTLRNDSMKQ